MRIVSSITSIRKDLKRDFKELLSLCYYFGVNCNAVLLALAVMSSQQLLSISSHENGDQLMVDCWATWSLTAFVYQP